VSSKTWRLLIRRAVPRYDFSQLAELNRQVSIPIAGGENNRGLHEFRQMCEQGVYDVLQPELLVMEGITALPDADGLLRENYDSRESQAPAESKRQVSTPVPLWETTTTVGIRQASLR
jgi:hypothetical protein